MLYTIEDTTLNGLADAIRSKTDNYIYTETPLSKPYEIIFDTREVEKYDGDNGRITYYIDLDLKDVLGDYYNQTKKIYIEYSYEAYLGNYTKMYYELNFDYCQAKGQVWNSAYMLDNVEAPLQDTKTYIQNAQVNTYRYRRLAANISKNLANNPDYYLIMSCKIWALNAEEKFISKNVMTPLEMIDEISGLKLEVDNKKLKYIIEKNANIDFTLTAEDLEGITSIGEYSFYNNDGLRGINLPEGITKIGNSSFYDCSYLGRSTNNELVLPSSLTSLGTSAFSGCNNIYTVRILNNKSIISFFTSADPFYNCINLTTIYIPNNLYEGYCNSSAWSIHKDKFVPVGEWVFGPVIKGSLLFNQSKEYSISLNDFDYTP
jgi:hypothetical protein